MQNYRRIFDTGRYLAFPGEESVETVVGVIHLFFRCLPEELLPAVPSSSSDPSSLCSQLSSLSLAGGEAGGGGASVPLEQLEAEAERLKALSKEDVEREVQAMRRAYVGIERCHRETVMVVCDLLRM
jgi:hypothetical protein